MDLKRYIREVPAFPEPGVRFRDITPPLQHAQACQHAVAAFAFPLELAGLGGREWLRDYELFSLIRYE